MTPSQATLLASTQLLATKLYPPRWGAHLVSRPRLLETLEQGSCCPLTLVTAPAGFGKSTLLAEWLSLRPETTGWLSLDRSDNDPATFWAYVIALLRRMGDQVGELALAMLHAPENVPIETVLSTLINDVQASGSSLTMILDDYHLIEDDEINAAMSFFVERMPPSLRIVLASRSQPALPIARLRGRGLLLEVTRGALRFTPEEAIDFLTATKGIEVSPEIATGLEQRTEGWIAGLHLAALSMRGRNDYQGFLEAFSGSNRFIADFLVEEVLRQQSDRVRDFLLQTSILDRLCGPLCDTVADEKGSADLLAQLERANLFVISLDDERRWYRYHHLFADVLRARLKAERPVFLPALHRRASAWLEVDGDIEAAIRHASLSGDQSRVADLVERSWRRMDRAFLSSKWLEWARGVPSDSVHNRPVLAMGIGWALLDAGKIDEASPFLDVAEQYVRSPSGMVVADEREWNALPGTLAAARAYEAQAVGNLEETERLARQALDLIPPEDHFYRGIPAVTVGMAQLERCELNEAFGSFSEGLRCFEAAGNQHVVDRARVVLADVRFAQGRLTEALSILERVGANGARGLAGGAVEAFRLGAEILVEQARLDEANERLEQARLLTSDKDPSHRWFAAAALLREARGDLPGALVHLDQAEQRYEPGRLPDRRPLRAIRARVLLAMGKPASLDVGPSSGITREYVKITQALLQGPEGVDLLLDLLEDATRGGRQLARVEILVRLARIEDSAQRLSDALRLAEAEGYLAVFLREGAAVRPRLEELVLEGRAGAFGRLVLAKLVGHGAAAGVGPHHEGTVQLTDREVEVLRLVAAGLKNQEAADKLFISLATVKRHIANVYGKLEVGSRTQAIKKAADLGLL